jgi:HEAT repeat protein
MSLDESAPTVRLLLEHSRGSTPAAAAWALGAMTPSDQNVRALLDAYIFGSPEIRPHAAHALASVGRRAISWQAVDDYDRSLVFFDRTSRDFAVERYLSGLFTWELVERDTGSPVVLDEFVEIVAAAFASGLSSDPGTRRRLLTELNASPDGLSLGGVMSGMTGDVLASHRSVVEQALRANVEVLAGLSERGDDSERALALSVRSKLADVGASSAARSCIESESAQVLVSCIRALVRVGDRADLQRVIRFVAHSEWSVRAAAVEAIALLGGPEEASVLREAAGDDFASVRAAALEGLLILEPVGAARLVGDAWSELPVAVRMRLARRAFELGVLSVVEVAGADVDRRVRDAAGE